ncbi:ferredoxin [Trujillonella humicola]|uniref:ferredoxin n=1 Tax=Trujillonella humicola TaxID=3383699 RepID=UPI003906724E
MRVEIHSDRCVGHGLCYTVAPDVFEDDDDGYGRVRGDGMVPPCQEEAARRGAANCPERAIELT